jgi:Flp pilus assembly protein TadB
MEKRIESGEQKRKATDAKQKSSRQFMIAIGKLLIAIVIALLLLALAWSSSFLPLVVFFLCLVAVWYITSKHEKWFYPKRKDKS